MIDWTKTTQLHSLQALLRKRQSYRQNNTGETIAPCHTRLTVARRGAIPYNDVHRVQFVLLPVKFSVAVCKCSHHLQMETIGFYLLCRNESACYW